MTIPPFRRSGPNSTTRGWATATPGVADQLRRGAWYPVVEEAPDGMITLEVDHEQIRVKREDLRFRADRPDQWSVVTRTGVMRPTLAGVKLVTTYAVCPDCTARQEFDGEPESLMCVRCRRAAKVDWDTTY
ncbi:MAG: hypothetical protein ABI587_16650 [Gemmatimonadales bacterium]